MQDWVRGVSPPAWTRRPRAKDRERQRARALRAEGRTYGEIARELSVSKSSVSLWTRDLDHPEPTPAGVDARRAGLRRYFAQRRVREAAARETEVRAATGVIGELTDREVLIAGAVAYWAEGTKSKPWRPAERVTFTNSDLDMVRLFLVFLGLLGVADDRVRLRLAIHESADIATATRFWSDGLGVPPTAFQRPTLKRSPLQPGRRNVDDGYHGCLVVGVLHSSSEYRRIAGMWAAVGAHASTLDRPSRVV